jgi:hypothetical protein
MRQAVGNGALASFSQATGTHQGTFWATPAGTKGAGIWSSPAGNQGGIYATTGNGPKVGAQGQPRHRRRSLAARSNRTRDRYTRDGRRGCDRGANI